MSASPKRKEPLDPSTLSFARNLRQQSTDAEQLLWRLLRNRRLTGHKFRRQHPIPPYVLDFYCDSKKLAIELDGGQHNTEEGRAHDEIRNSFLATKGITLLRFWNDVVLTETEAVLEAIHNALTAR
ncbi:MAG: endonuclease domain-containing protein [Pirellulales bacterium]